MTKNPLSNDIYLKRTTYREPDIRGDYFRDQTAIIHSMPFRRLKHKTQVFFAPQNDHVCTRIEHVMHVATIAATICKGLNSYGWNLDTELAYAIGLGHDIGHPPFGHAGEEVLDKKLGGNFSFVHEVNSYRVVEHLTNNGRGLNLTYAVKDGIICHNGENYEKSLKPVNNQNELEKIKDRKCIPTSYEGCITRFADKIAYLGRDIEDAIIANFINIQDVPSIISNELGNKNGEIINNLVIDIIESSKDSDKICFSDEKFELLIKLKEFNYEQIYNHKKISYYIIFCQRIINSLFDYLSELYNKFGSNYERYYEQNINLDNAFGKYLEDMDEFYSNEKTPAERIITDYISGMTDLYALECMKQISIPKPIDFA